MQREGAFGDRFVRQHLVGRGGVGSVYRAVDRASGQIVALKVLNEHSPHAIERFEYEARVLADLAHPNIVRYVAHGVATSGEPYLALEWLEGESLATRLGRGPLGVDEAVGLARRVAGALGAAHARGVVHRDVKPSNLFLPGGVVSEVRVLDFGLAHDASCSQVITRTGGVVGTPGYMAPEQARGERERIDARADVFSLGAVLFECLTGRRAFEGVHVIALLAQLLLADVPRVRELRPEVPPALEAILMRMLSKDPDGRPADGAEVLRAIEALGGGEAAPVTPPAPATAIGGEEQRLLAIVTVTPGPADADERAWYEPADAVLARVHSIAALRGARVDRLVSGALLVTLTGQGSATDQAARAARCALRLRATLPHAAMALVMGHGEAGGRLPVGQVVDRAAELLGAEDRAAPMPSPGPRPVRIDEVTYALLDARFDVRDEGSGHALVGERDIGEGARTLLGRPSPYVGRERELRMLEDLIHATFEGDRGAQAVLVVASAGVGKSRLRHELVRSLRASRPDLALGVGRADAMSAGAAFGVVGSAIRNAIGIAPDEPVASARERLLDRLAPHVPPADLRRVASFVGELAGVPFPEGEAELDAARADAEVMAEQIARAFLDFLRGVSSAHPVLLVLEDLHWGDAASIKLVDQALRELEDRPFVVLALARPEVHDAFPELWAKRDVHHVCLGALPRRAAEELVARAIGAEVPPADLARIVDQAAGNAFYLEELIRAFAEGRGDRLPETVLGMVEARIEALPAEARRLLRAASVFGEAFAKAGALALLPEGERAEAERRWLPWLVEHELVIRRVDARTGVDEHSFRHALLREGSFAMLTERDRVLGHRLAAAWIEGSQAGGDARHALVGEHYLRGEVWDAAFRHLDQAGDAARRLHANPAARRHYRRALEALARMPDDVDARRLRVDTILKKASVSYGDDPRPNLARLTAAEAIAEALPGAADPSSEDRRRLAKIHFWLGRTHWYLNAYPEAVGYYRRVLEAAQAIGDDELVALPSGTIGRVLFAKGQFAGARPFLERALAPLERTGNLAEWVVNAGYVGVIHTLAGRAAEGLAAGERAAARAREMKSRTSVSITHTILGGMHVFRGDPARGLDLTRVAVENAEAAGDRIYAYLAYFFGAWAAARAGLHETSDALRSKAQEVIDEMGRRLVLADWYDAFALEAAQRAGRLDEVLDRAPDVIQSIRAAGGAFAEGLAERAWGLALAGGDDGAFEEAAAHLDASVRLLEQSEALVEAARSRIGLAILEGRRGDAPAAAAHLAAAAPLLEAAEVAAARAALAG